MEVMRQTPSAEPSKKPIVISDNCQVCEGDEPHPAASRCLDCKESMCTAALGFHAKFQKDHLGKYNMLEHFKAFLSP